MLPAPRRRGLHRLAAVALLLWPSAQASPLVGMAPSVAAGERTAVGAGSIQLAWRPATAAGPLRELFSPFDLSLTVAETLSRLGVLAGQRGDLAQAQVLLSAALELQEPLAPDSLALGRLYNNLGIVARHQGETEKAAGYLLRDLAISERLTPGSLNVASTLNNLGLVHRQEGDLEAAEAALERALALRRQLDPEGLSVPLTLVNLGGLAAGRGDLALAERHCREALVLTEAVPTFEPHTAAAHSCLGAIAFERAALDMAEEHHLQALQLYRRHQPASEAVAVSLNNLAGVAFRRGDWLRAERYQSRSLALTAKNAPGSWDHAVDLDNLGWIELHRGEPARAEALHRQALAIHEELSPGGIGSAQSLYLLGLALEGRDIDSAVDALQQAFDLRRQLTPHAKETADAAFQLARLQRRLGQTTSALDLLRQALDTLDEQYSIVGGSAEDRSLFAADFASIYHEAIDLLVQSGHAPEAFHVLERYRARTLLQLLRSRPASLQAEIPSDLLRQRRLADAQYDAIYYQLATTEGDTERIQTLAADLRRARHQRQQIASEIRAAVPRLAQLPAPRALDLEATRASLPTGTLLLSYVISKAGCYLFTAGLDAGDVSVTRLEFTAEELTDAVHQLRRTLALGQVDPRHQRLDLRRRSLGRWLLQPAAAAIARAERLLILPDGPLHQLPFALLPYPANEDTFLVESKSLHVAASATVLAQLRRTSPQPRPRRLLAFADPLSSHPTPATAARTRTSASPTLPPLPASRAEVQALADLFPDAARIFVGAEATEARVKALAGDATLLHFACHSRLDDRSPFDSALVLAPAPDGPASDRENGFLQVWEIFEQLRLDADLVALSACATAAGREAGGEGLVGLAYAFQYAGARSVLASLWPVSDSSTAELMRRFYTHLRDGESTAEALRRAQVDLLQEPASAHPFHWAGFRLIGNGG